MQIQMQMKMQHKYKYKYRQNTGHGSTSWTTAPSITSMPSTESPPPTTDPLNRSNLKIWAWSASLFLRIFWKVLMLYKMFNWKTSSYDELQNF